MKPFLNPFTTLGRLAPRLSPLAQLALRFALAVPFFRSGLTKWDGFGKLSDSAAYLFRDEFRLHLLGATVPYPAPVVMAVQGTLTVTLPADRWLFRLWIAIS